MKTEHDVTSDHFVTRIELHNHLLRCDDYFIPRLSSYVDIDQYVLKLYERAKKVAVFDGDRIIALGAFYITNRNCGFITNMSVDPSFQSSGLGKRLLSLIEQELAAADVNQLELEVFDCNSKALGFYLSNGFIVVDTNGSKKFLRKYI